MSWFWLYLGGLALWLFGMTAAVVATTDPGRTRDGQLAGAVILAPIWPLGLCWVGGHLAGAALKPKKAPQAK